MRIKPVGYICTINEPDSHTAGTAMRPSRVDFDRNAVGSLFGKIVFLPFSQLAFLNCTPNARAEYGQNRRDGCSLENITFALRYGRLFQLTVVTSWLHNLC